MQTLTVRTPRITDFTILPDKEVRQATMADVRHDYNLPSLSELTTNHMSHEKRQRFERLIISVRKWRQDAPTNSGLSFLLSSKQVGVGKTHIAKAVNASFCRVVGNMQYIGDVAQFRVEHRSRLFTARQLINLLGGDAQKDLWEIVPKHVTCLVIDDLGREGYLDYVKADQQGQEKESRYFHLINHLYETRKNGRFPVNLFITTNLTANEVQTLLGEASWSRLLQMCPKGYIVEPGELDDYRRIVSGRA